MIVYHQFTYAVFEGLYYHKLCIHYDVVLSSHYYDLVGNIFLESGWVYVIVAIVL